MTMSHDAFSGVRLAEVNTRRMVRSAVSAFLGVVVLTTAAATQALPSIEPSRVGMSGERLDRLEQVIGEYVENEALPGAVSLVARRGGVAHLEAYGYADREAGERMEADAIFRLASMTKPVTSVAVMMLYEEGKFRLNDPVSRYLPELGDLEVLEITDTLTGASRLVPARPITIRHLLTHSSGITYRFLAEMNPSYRQRHFSEMYRDVGIADGLSEHPATLQDLVESLGQVPLMHQPGAAFSYGLSVDVLGRLVEVLSGMSFDEFLRTRLFEPLGMEDTYFYLPEDKASRLVALYSPSPGGGLVEEEGRVDLTHLSYSATYPIGDQRTYFPGGAGLSSTARDYARFLQMLLNGGELDGARILSPLTIEVMTSDHLGSTPTGMVGPGSGGFGLGFAVTGPPNRGGELTSEGSYYWSGFFNTSFWVDPQQELFGILLTNVYPGRGIGDLSEKFRIMTYQAVVEE
ncbi:MAG: serine hydrolase domain-containing protein [Gemmatimonadota bacterium]